MDDWQRKRRFRGPVIGPIGSFVKIATGKEQFASLAEMALGVGTLDRFIVTNVPDRKTFLKLREFFLHLNRPAGIDSDDCSINSDQTLKSYP